MINNTLSTPSSKLRLIGLVGGGSIPQALLASLPFLILLRFLSLRAITDQSTCVSEKKEMLMSQNTLNTRIFSSSTLETIWAIGVGGVAGSLSA